MPASTLRRRVDWDVVLPGHANANRTTRESTPSRLLELTREVVAAPSPATIDRLLRHTVEYTRVVLELERTALYLLDAKHGVMVGTFGTGASGETVDERGLMYEFGPTDRDVFARAELGFPWTVYDNCPLVAQQSGKTSTIGRGWVACTAVRGARDPIGVFYNDSAISHNAFDEAKQSHLAILCSLLGRALEPYRGFLVPAVASALAPQYGVVQRVTEALTRDPSLSCDVLARNLKFTPRNLARTFKRETQMSIVEYRNELRLARFFGRVDAEADHLLEAAREAGFGSYAQFHRVFHARYGQSPRDHVLERRHKR